MKIKLGIVLMLVFSMICIGDTTFARTSAANNAQDDTTAVTTTVKRPRKTRGLPKPRRRGLKKSGATSRGLKGGTKTRGLPKTRRRGMGNPKSKTRSIGKARSESENRNVRKN